MKQQYRSEMGGIIADILSVTIDGGARGALASIISRRANLSHYTLLDKCKKLIDAGWLESTRNDGNRIFRITEKGIRLFQEFQRFESMVQAVNLRY